MLGKSIKLNKALFLDRDGVINVDKGYVHRWVDFEFMPDVIEAMRRFSRAGFKLIVVTNQSGIARGLFTEEQFKILTAKIENHLKRRGVPSIETYYCPHLPDGVIEDYAITCHCRKPAPGLLLQAARDHSLKLSQTALVGDKHSDISAATAAGVGRSFLMVGDRPCSEKDIGTTFVKSLGECADMMGVP